MVGNLWTVAVWISPVLVGALSAQERSGVSLLLSAGTVHPPCSALHILSSYKGCHIPILHHVVDLLTHLLGDLKALLLCHGGALS